LITVLVDSLPEAGEEAPAVSIDGETYRHLCRARRAEVGDSVRLTDGRGTARWAVVESIDRRRARLVCRGDAPTNEPERDVELWVGTLRSSRASWLVEKATELGVGAIRFFSSERAARSYGDAGIARLERVTRAAVEQSHRALRPPVDGVHPWAEVLNLAPSVVLDPIGSQRGNVTLFTEKSGPLVIVVGPEGGWSPSERDQLEEAGHLFVSLGSRTLRVETAALAGLALALSGS